MAALLEAPQLPPAADGLGRHFTIALVSTLSFAALLVVWASTMQVASAALAPGRVVVEGNRKAIQHPDGGPIGAVFVKEGEAVAKGQPLLELDLSAVRAEFAVLQSSKAQLVAKIARLRAEVAGADAFSLPPSVSPDDPEIASFFAQEQALFTARRSAYFGNVSILKQTIDGCREQIQALEGKLAAAKEQLRLYKEERDNLAPLVAKGFATKTRVIALQRAEAGAQGDMQQIEANLSEQRARINESEFKSTQLSKDRVEGASKDLSDAEAQLAQTLPRLTSAQDRLGRGQILSPEAGYVYNLAVYGPGAAVTPGQVIMEIVPLKDALVLQVEVSPNDIDRVQAGQPTVIHLLPYKQRFQLKIGGTLMQISPDEFEDKVKQTSYYKGLVTVDAKDLANAGATLIPGMPVQAMIQTGSRTIMAYLLDPLYEVSAYAMRDD